MPKKIMISVGEPSGDLHAARLLEALNQRPDPPHCFGMGGERMRQAGFEVLVGIEKMAVMGLVEVIRNFSTLYGVLREMRNQMREQRPDLLILVDYPGFNMLLAKTAKRLGVPVLYYISPKIWVWRERRIYKIARLVDHMALIFPFELSYYERVGLPATYVGHPLVGQVGCGEERAVVCNRLGLDPDRSVVGLFPGSRRSEVQALLPEMVEMACLLSRQQPDTQFLLSKVAELPDELYSAIDEHRDLIRLVEGDAHCTIHACDAIVTASGTVTLEMALLDRPMVVVYRMAPFSYAIISRMLKTPWVSLVNIIAGRAVVAELLQEHASAKTMLDHLLPILQRGDARNTMLQGLAEVREALGEGASAERLADLVAEMVA